MKFTEFPFNSKFIQIEGFNIHYIEEGQGKPILLIHGNPTSSYLWRNLIGSLSQKTSRRVIAIDLLGFGLSDKPNINYT
ncbi:MAG: alpha/beta fold hydrolase, partial [Cyclobacteriaceae bacterium]